MKDININEDGQERAVRLRNREAFSRDNINTELIKYEGCCLTQKITKLCQKIITIKHYCSNSQRRNKRDLQNYRGITLLSIVSKVFTTVIKNELSGCIISEEQQGFRRSRYIHFIDMIKVYDSVQLNDATNLFKNKATPAKNFNIISKKNMGNNKKK